MKKIFLTLLLAATLLLSACSSPGANPPSIDFTSSTEGSVIEIKERFFITRLNDIYLNKEKYIGRTIKLEGIFGNDYWEADDKRYFSVYRNGPGCCFNDSQAGIEVIYPESTDIPYPENNAWVEAIGVLEEYQEDGATYLRLRLDRLEEKQDRGAETVTN